MTQTVSQFKHANQFLIWNSTPEKTTLTFQSYESTIATLERVGSVETLILNGSMWDYSNTTRKHFKLFINENTHFKYEDKAQWLKEIAQNPQVVTQ